MTSTNRPSSIRRPQELISAEQVDERTRELAAQIDRDYATSNNVLCIGVLKGAVFFFTDLLKHIERPLKVDFVQTSSYRDSTTPGEVRLKRDLDLTVLDADVLLIEDIVDTGHTLATLLKLLRDRGARSLKLCSLLSKPSRREVEIAIDYCGFEIEDHFVVGYGLDYAEHYRNLPYIGILEQDAGGDDS